MGTKSYPKTDTEPRKTRSQRKSSGGSFADAPTTRVSRGTAPKSGKGSRTNPGESASPLHMRKRNMYELTPSVDGKDNQFDRLTDRNYSVDALPDQEFEGRMGTWGDTRIDPLMARRRGYR